MRKQKRVPKQKQKEQQAKTCFVMMPISDVPTYESGHFNRVYEFIIMPACKAAGFKPIRADDVQVTNFIIVDILKKILEAEMVVCDLSSRNPNVLYELGIRQAFNLPVTLIRDLKTPRIFDIQGLRDIEYDESLRIDKITDAVKLLTQTLKNNSNLERNEINSIIQLLAIMPASIPSTELSIEHTPLLDQRKEIVLNALENLGKELSKIKDIIIKP
jgi:hypothetical protein